MVGAGPRCCRGDGGRPGGTNRRFVEAVLWRARSGASGPCRRPNWYTMYTRFARWAKSRAWGQLLAAVQTREAGLGTLLLDSTTVRAHQHTAVAQKNGADPALGRSHDGLSTKQHLLTDALGRPKRALLTAVSVHNRTLSEQVLTELWPARLVADRGYDARAWWAYLIARGTLASFPPSASAATRPRAWWPGPWPRGCEW